MLEDSHSKQRTVETNAFRVIVIINTMNQISDEICLRALAFERTFDFVNQRVISSDEAPPDVVTKYGTPGSNSYRRVRIAMEWSPVDVAKLLAACTDDEAGATKAFFDAGMELVVICSTCDVIYHEFVGVQPN